MNQSAGLLRAYSTTDIITNDDTVTHGITQLTTLSAISVRGDKAESFLQSHVTADLRKIQTIMPSALCNQKGRIFSLFYVQKVATDEWQLLLQRDLVQSTLKKLNKTALLSRVQLEEIGQCYTTAEYFNMPVEKTITQNQWLATQMLVTIHASETNCNEYIKTQQKNGATPLEEQHFYAYKLKLGWFELYPHTQKLFLPTVLKLIENKTVSVKKGCYLGHEIIARLHFKAIDKYDSIIVEREINKMPGDSIHLEEETIGIVIDKAQDRTGQYIYALSVKLAKKEAYLASLK